MARRLVEDLEVGMVLSQDLHDQRGRFLLPAGLALGDQHLRLLRQWRVPVVFVESAGEESGDWRQVSLQDLSPELHMHHEKELSNLFSLVNRTAPFVSRLFYFQLDRLDRLSQQDTRKP